MNYRIAELFKDTAMGASGTEPIEINVKNPISQIIIKQRSTGSQDAPTAHLAAVLPKIEIVDGSEKLFSLAAYEADAFDFYHRKKSPFNVNTYLNNVQGIRSYHINFGRYLWDEVLAFDPTKFKNPQLRIQYDRDAGGCLSDLLEIQVVAKLFDEKAISPIGFLMHKQIKQYALGAGTWDYTNMPTDYPWRMLLMSARASQRHPHNQFREIKLDEDVDAKIPFHFDTMNLISWLQDNFPVYHENLYCSNGSAERTYYVTPAYFAVFGGNMQSGGYVTQASYHGQGGTYPLTGSGAGNIIGNVHGFCPHGAVVVPFGKPDVIEDWYDVRKIGKLRLSIKGHASRTAGNLQICLQQLRPY